MFNLVEPASPAHVTNRLRWSTRVVSSAEALLPHVPAWEALAAAALEPNVFYEPWMMLPALRSVAGATKFRFVFVYAQHSDEAGQLCGFFPLEFARSYRRLPVSVVRSWAHAFGPLGTPLIRAGMEGPCLREFFGWLARGPESAALVEFHLFPRGGPFHRALAAQLEAGANPTMLREEIERALFRRGAGSEEYLQNALSRDQRKSLRRKAKRLAEIGVLEYRHLEPGGDLDAWLDEFFRMEASGWKGSQGTALAQDPAKRAFLVDACRAAFRLDRLRFLSLRVQDRAIACQLYFPAGAGAFAWKTAYDEEFSRFSPGILIQTELIRRLHETAECDWMDSTSEPDGYLNEVWLDRLALQTLLVAAGGWTGRLAMSILPAILRWKERLKILRRESPPPAVS